MKTCCGFFILFICAATQAAPLAPQVNAGADLKQIRFDWSPVPAVTRYELWYRATAAAPWRKLQQPSASATHAIISLSVHLTDWRNARWRLDACDASGCTPSEELDLRVLMRDTVGYFKSNQFIVSNHFGEAVALSADGRTLAAAGSEFGGPNGWVGIGVHVYRRVGADWRYDATVGAEQVSPEIHESHSIAINGDGTVLAIGTPLEFGAFPGWGSGAVYVYRRIDGFWRFEQKFQIEELFVAGSLGVVVDIDDAGDLIAAEYADFIGDHRGGVRLYRRGSDHWTLEKDLKLVVSGAPAVSACSGLSLSGDGNHLARHCARSIGNPAHTNTRIQTFSAPSWNLQAQIPLVNEWVFRAGIDLNRDGSLLAATVDSNFSSVWRWTSTGWQPDSPSGAPVVIPVSDFSLAMSANGNYIAIGAPADGTGGLGVVYPPFLPGVANSGTVRVFERKGGAWSLRQALKANTSTPQRFGYSLAFGDNGSVMAVGAVADSSDATGIDGDQFDMSRPDSGAVWLY